MKKSLIALAVLATAGLASAQSSVTLFGVVDVTYEHLRADGNGKQNLLTDSGYNSSRLGFRGTEDLGGGMSASFWLEAGINPDNGTGDASNVNNQAVGAFVPATGANAAVRPGTQGLVFNRRSTVSLAGGWGEVRLGRDYVPSFWNLTNFDPFGTNGVGSSSNLTIGAGGGTSAAASLVTGVRASNSVGYFLPGNLGGFYGQAMYAFGENASNAAGGTDKDGRHIGARVGYANGPFDVAIGYGNTDYAAGDYRAMNIGGQWNFGFGKLMAQWARDEVKSVANPKQTSWLLGGLVPVGAGEVRLSYVRTNVSGTSNDADLIALGYVHNLSKRTAVYTTFARINNKGAGTLFHNGRATTVAGGNVKGFDLGLRHAF
jgi:predicted porin